MEPQDQPAKVSRIALYTAVVTVNLVLLPGLHLVALLLKVSGFVVEFLRDLLVLPSFLRQLLKDQNTGYS